MSLIEIDSNFMNIKRIINRLVFHFAKLGIVGVSYLNHRAYMKMYIPLLKRNGMKITGMPRYIGAHVRFDDFDKIEIGDRVVISDESILLTHDYSITTALISINEPPTSDIALVRDIKIGNNVFIGKRSIIMPNTQIGNNVIVGAGSVVRGIIPDDSVIIGNPATVVGSVADQAQKWKNKLGTSNTRQD